MNSSQCRDYLDRLQTLGIKLGLDNIRTLLASLGNPHLKYPTILVAGTNGKGSVCAMLAEVLKRHGFRAGLYTSPHLVTMEERIRVGGRVIPSRSFCGLIGRIRDRIDALLAAGDISCHPTYFEVLTAAAFLYFAERKTDIAVVEVGMGGRYDATNVVHPLISVITTIARDHQKYLGSTLGQIAFEKAGIIKPGVPVVCGVEKGIALRTIRRRARELRAPVHEVFGEGSGFAAAGRGAGLRFSLTVNGRRRTFRPSLQGFHQGKNGAVALAAADVLSRTWARLDPETIIEGIESARWPGRLETIRRRPLVILDGAHNEEGEQAVRAFLLDSIRRPVILVFAVMADKDIRRLVRILFPLAQKVILTRFPSARAADPEKILEQAGEFRDRITIERDVRKAYALALVESKSRVPVVVTGSLFLVGEIKRLGLDRFQR
ncbi:MAG: bifunctional folylpolyglutamate synthase/dihydrofolate synthase [Acidobacteriota bacterium]|nr:bifunctional folylpolyglutamate synthase/dihydrofolate synthase [Acidobacteriota bacterium]